MLLSLHVKASNYRRSATPVDDLYMKAIFPPVSEQHRSNFIVQNNAYEHLTVTPSDIENTLSKKAVSPLVAGHLSAINQMYVLLNDPFFPAKDPIQWKNINNSDSNLLWLRNLHYKMFKYFAEYNQYNGLESPLKVADCGSYRLTNRFIVNRPMPKPLLIKPLLHQWYSMIGTFHLKVANQLRRPSNPLLLEIEAMTIKIHHQLQCIHPFVKGTGQVARLLENLFRLRWGLPWKSFDVKQKLPYVKSIMAYEDGDEWQAVLKSVSAVQQ